MSHYWNGWVPNGMRWMKRMSRYRNRWKCQMEQNWRARMKLSHRVILDGWVSIEADGSVKWNEIDEPALKLMSVKWNGMDESDEPVSKPMEVSNEMKLMSQWNVQWNWMYEIRTVITNLLKIVRTILPKYGDGAGGQRTLRATPNGECYAKGYLHHHFSQVHCT